MDETWCLLLFSNATYFHYAPVLHLWDLLVVACPECNWIYSSSPLTWTYKRFPVSLKLSGSLLLSWLNVSLLSALSFIYLLLSREDFLQSGMRGLHSWACAQSSAFLILKVQTGTTGAVTAHVKLCDLLEAHSWNSIFICITLEMAYFRGLF